MSVSRQPMESIKRKKNKGTVSLKFRFFQIRQTTIAVILKKNQETDVEGDSNLIEKGAVIGF